MWENCKESAEDSEFIPQIKDSMKTWSTYPEEPLENIPSLEAWD